MKALIKIAIERRKRRVFAFNVPPEITFTGLPLLDRTILIKKFLTVILIINE